MDFSKLKNLLDEIISDYNSPGVDCIVYKNHEMVFRYYTGVSDIEKQTPLRGDELYLIYSMTKMITCTAALQLLEKGKYNLDDPIDCYIPEFAQMQVSHGEFNNKKDAEITKGNFDSEVSKVSDIKTAKNKITVKNLLTMTAGFDYVVSDEAITGAIQSGKSTTLEIATAMANKVLCFEPGTHFQYSLCHDVLGALIEIWSGETLGEYMRRNIFEPVGMSNTFFHVPTDEARLSKMATLYRYNERRIPEKMPLKCSYELTPNFESGGAGLISCTEDYALFLDALACGGTAANGNKILSPETVKLMSTNHLGEDELADFNNLRKGYGYGLGVRTHLFRDKSGAISPLGEFGWDGAAGGFSMVDPHKNISLTFFQHILKWKTEIENKLKNALYEGMEQK